MIIKNEIQKKNITLKNVNLVSGNLSSIMSPRARVQKLRHGFALALAEAAGPEESKRHGRERLGLAAPTPAAPATSAAGAKKMPLFLKG